jgi:hypothetical protein
MRRGGGVLKSISITELVHYFNKDALVLRTAFVFRGLSSPFLAEPSLQNRFIADRAKILVGNNG